MIVEVDETDVVVLVRFSVEVVVEVVVELDSKLVVVLVELSVVLSEDVAEVVDVEVSEKAVLVERAVEVDVLVVT